MRSYHPGDPSRQVEIGTAATLYQDPSDGRKYILIINEALLLTETNDGTLLNPNQLRMNGCIVHEGPKRFVPDSLHRIEIKSRTDRQGLVIPLSLRAVFSGFESTKPTFEDVETYPHIELTSSEFWEPHSPAHAEEEEQLTAAYEGPNRVEGVCTRGESFSGDYAMRQVASIQAYSAAFKDPHGDPTLAILNDTPWLEGQEFETRIVGCVGTRMAEQIIVAADDYIGDGLSGRGDSSLYSVSDEWREVAKLTTEGGYNIEAVATTERKSVITPEMLARRWMIPLPTAKRTLKVTTQAGVRNILLPGDRKVRQRLDHLRFPNLKGRFYSDTMFSKVTSLRSNKCAQVFTNGLGFDEFYPIKSKGEAPQTLMKFVHDVGIMQTCVTDGAPELTEGEWGRICRRFTIQQQTTVPYSPWRNLAEHSIRELKQGIRRATGRAKSPKRLWDYCGEWVAAIRRVTALDLPQLEGEVPETHVRGTTTDISSLALFDWYEPVEYHMPTNGFPNAKRLLGRFVGVAAEVTIDEMAFRILTESGKVVVRKSVWGIEPERKNTDLYKAELHLLDEAIKSKLGDSLDDNEIDPELVGIAPEVPDYLFDEDEVQEPYDKSATVKEADDYFTSDAYDQYLTAEVLIPQGGVMKKAVVKRRATDQDGNPIGRRNPNPILDSREYEVQFPDGSVDILTANKISESILTQVDSEGRSYSVLKEITDHRKDGTALSIDDGFIESHKGRKSRRITTKGWELLVCWADGSTSWIPLKDIKNSNPVEVAEYAVANKIVSEPAFAWWVPAVLKKRDRIIAKVKSRYWSRTHKFGVRMPKSVKEALEIDAETGTDFWRLAIEREMRNIMPAFQFLDDDKVPVGYKHIDFHMIFDVKFDLTRKARFVAGGHKTEPPKESTYSSVVSRDSVRIAFLIAALNDLDILAADIQNAYLNADTKERVYTTAGMEFGADKVGRPVLVVRAAYGLRGSGKAFRDHMAATLRDAGYVSSKADPDVYMRKQCKPGGYEYWEYVLTYVDDILVVSHNPGETMKHLQERYTLKEGSVKEPDTYLGAEISKYDIGDEDSPGKMRWSMSCNTYVKRAVAEVERVLSEVGLKLSSKASTPMAAGYRPEIDGSDVLDSERANYFQGLIGILRWICELGRIDIIVDVSMLSRYLAEPREGHLEQAFHIFAYLKKHGRSRLVFDETVPVFDESRFDKCDWEEFYPGAKEVIPLDVPEERGNGVVMSCFVDADHAGCRVTRRSQTGIIIFLNRAPILWYSKRQNTIESSTFGSEFIAAKTAVEMIEGLRYKLRMMGIPILGATNVFCDNESVVKNSTRPESVLKKKHNAIAYHRVREAQAAGHIRMAKEDGDTNLADILTKCLPGPRLKRLLGHILY